MKKIIYTQFTLGLALTLALCVTSAGSLFAQPANDQCANAIAIMCDGGPVVVNGTTAGAATESVPFCGTPSTSPGVWYTFIGSGAPTTVSTCDAAFFYDTKVSVYTGTCGNFTCVAGNDDNCNINGLQSTVNFQSTQGTEYYVLVHGFGGGSGNFVLTVSACEAMGPPPVDTCEVTCPTDEVIFLDPGACEIQYG